MNYEIKQIRETVFDGDKRVLEINIKYPYLELESKTAEREINMFYQRLASYFLSYAKTKSASKASAVLSNEDRRPFGEVVLSKVVPCDGFVSVILDVMSYDGIFTKQKRFAHVWSQDGYMLPYKYFLAESEAKIKKALMQSLYMELNGVSEHDYFAGCMKKLNRYFDKHSFFVTDNGVVFFYQAGVLSPQNEGCVCFTLPLTPQNKK